MKFRNIIVAGDVGTGTTTLAKALAEKFDWKYISAGDFFRSYALENNIPLWDKKSVPDKLDRAVDKKFFEIIRDQSGFVFDTHYGGYFARNIDDVFKILLTCNAQDAEERILSRGHTHKEAVNDIRKRRVENLAKFHKLYSKENPENPKYFDLVIDTTNSTPEETFQKALISL